MVQGVDGALARLCNFVICLNEILGVQVSVTSYSLIEGLLLLQLTFELRVGLLELRDVLTLELDFFDHLHKVCVGL